MPVIEYEGEQFEFPEDATDAEIFDYLEKQVPVKEDEPEPLLPEGTPEYIKQNEGYSDKPYKDSRGIRTIGYGFNMQDKANQQLAARLGVRLDKPLKQQDAERLFKHSIVSAEEALRSLDEDYDTRPDDVKKALLDMSYNLGASRLNEFTSMFEALKSGDYKAAGYEVMRSLYAAQVPVRARNNAKLLIRAGIGTKQYATQQASEEVYSPGMYEDEAGNRFIVAEDGVMRPAND